MSSFEELKKNNDEICADMTRMLSDMNSKLKVPGDANGALNWMLNMIAAMKVELASLRLQFMITASLAYAGEKFISDTPEDKLKMTGYVNEFLQKMCNGVKEAHTAYMKAEKEADKPKIEIAPPGFNINSKLGETRKR